MQTTDVPLTTMSIAKKLNNMYYGWFIVIGLALVTFLDFGARASFGVYVHEWEKEFENMITYANSKGWLSEDQTHLLAHIEIST